MSPTRHEAAAYRSAAPQTLLGLHGAIKGRMAILAEGFWPLATKSGGERAPALVDGWLPPMTSPDVERFPFLIVRPHTGTDSEEGGQQDARAAFDLIIGIYKDADDGWMEVLQVIDALRLDLGAKPRIEGTGFEHTGPLTWELLAPVDPFTSTRPQWFGVVTTNWTLPRPRRELEA